MASTANRTGEEFSHEALFYSGHREFTDRCSQFLREGIAAGEPMLVMVTEDKIEMLQGELEDAAGQVAFVNMAEAGRNPGRIISAWREFATEHGAGGQPMRGIGEPIWKGRRPDELLECQQHEALINLAFEDADGFRLMCPYDVAALPPDVIEEARSSHPLILEDTQRHVCGTYRNDRAHDYHRQPLEPPAGEALDLRFERGTLPALRSFVAGQAAEAGLGSGKSRDLVIAASEAADNSVLHAGGNGVIRVWTNEDCLVHEVRDHGRLVDPVLGRVRPPAGAVGGHGLWLIHQLCDLVQIRATRRGTVVRMHMRLGSA